MLGDAAPAKGVQASPAGIPRLLTCGFVCLGILLFGCREFRLFEIALLGVRTANKHEAINNQEIKTCVFFFRILGRYALNQAPNIYLRFVKVSRGLNHDFTHVFNRLL